MVEVMRQVYRRGLELVPGGAGWKLSSDEVIANPASLLSSCGATPILIEQKYPTENRVSLMTPAMNFFGVETTWLMQRFLDPSTAAHFLQWKEVVYLVDAVGYHCKNLAIAYARIRNHFVWITRIPNHGDNDQASLSGGTEDVWYELDALLSAARRMLDISRYVLWKAFGRGTCPRNFRTTLSAAKDIPSRLRERLESTWERYGAKLTEYRDCIQHNASLTRGFGDVRMDKRTHGVWLVSAVLPDNPETKSQDQFSYKLKLDALDYAYEVTMEWLESAKAIASHIAPHPAFDEPAPDPSEK